MKKALVIGLAVVLFGAGRSSHTGTWTRGADGERPGGSLLTRREGETIQFQLECWRGAPSYNSGFIAGHFTVIGDKGVFRSSEEGLSCELEFVFSADKVTIRYVGESAGCGFGHGVYANGSYRRTSRKRPTFSPGDPRSQ